MTGSFEGLVHGATTNATRVQKLARLHSRQRWDPNAQLRPVDAPVENTLGHCWRRFRKETIGLVLAHIYQARNSCWMAIWKDASASPCARDGRGAIVMVIVLRLGRYFRGLYCDLYIR